MKGSENEEEGRGGARRRQGPERAATGEGRVSETVGGDEQEGLWAFPRLSGADRGALPLPQS